jgi:hypothetical protein
MEVYAKMEMEQLLSTTEFDCEQNETAFDDCVLSESLTNIPCLLPFQQESLLNSSTLQMCQRPDESILAYKKLQLATWACKPPCRQLTTEFEYSQPQYLRFHFLSIVHKNTQIPAYYLNLPNTIKVSRGVLNYGLIYYVADIAGWFNLFLGGSILVLWDRIWMVFCFFLAKFKKFKKVELLTLVQQKILIVLICGILLYILVDCVITVINSPIESSTVLASNLSGFGLSICLPQYTYQLDKFQTYKDVANTSEFWRNGSSLTSKIYKLRVNRGDGGLTIIWNNNTNSSSGQSNLSLFKSINVVKDMSVNFCNFLDISALPFPIAQVWINAVDDVTLAFHLAGQLLSSQNYYQIANMETIAISNGRISWYVSEVRLHIEETSFQQISANHCQNYNSSWTYDDCLLDSALSKFGSQQGHRPIIK